MTERRSFEFNDHRHADLLVDALYKGGSLGNTADDPISKLMLCGNQGGFRIVRKRSGLGYRLVCLYSTLVDTDWPDDLDMQLGKFVYYGDNKEFGKDLHEPRGNSLLRDVFNSVHSSDRTNIPPFFIFTKAGNGRDVIFRGIAVPGAEGLSGTEDLVAVWKTKKGNRFQNYKALFTVLDVGRVSRKWIEALAFDQPLASSCPLPWRIWVESGVYTPLQAPRALLHRSKYEQQPISQGAMEIVECIYQYFKDDPYKFEQCAVAIAVLMDRNIVECDVTRPWRDGGRDAIGKYKIGFNENSIKVEFALEAKCYKADSSVGVRETSRLIARLRYRQFGILVTTSYVHEQAYKEIIEDGHPVIVIAGSDIANILIQAGYASVDRVSDWLRIQFPKESKSVHE